MTDYVHFNIQDTQNIDTIRQCATEVSTMSPYCYPLDIQVDKELMLESLAELFQQLGYSYNSIVELLRSDFFEKYKQLGKSVPVAWDMNITHYPELSGSDRWRKFRGAEEWILSEGGDPRRATELLYELKGTYLETLIRSIFKHHQQTFDREFKGQLNITWIGPGQKYNLHVDSTVHLRYHIPLITNPSAFWIFQDVNNTSVFYKMHMPVGKVWLLHPVDIAHTVVNDWDTARAHLILTEFK